jgi:hypothetical protein
MEEMVLLMDSMDQPNRFLVPCTLSYSYVYLRFELRMFLLSLNCCQLSQALWLELLMYGLMKE